MLPEKEKTLQHEGRGSSLNHPPTHPEVVTHCLLLKLDYLPANWVPTPPREHCLWGLGHQTCHLAGGGNPSRRREPSLCGEAVPSLQRHRPRHLVPCLPWHRRLAQVGLSRERLEAWPADPPGGQRGRQDRGSVELGEGCTERNLAQLHTWCSHCSPRGTAAHGALPPKLGSPSGALRKEITWARGPEEETDAPKILDMLPPPLPPKFPRKQGG